MTLKEKYKYRRMQKLLVLIEKSLNILDINIVEENLVKINKGTM